MEIFPRNPKVDWIGKRFLFFGITGVLQAVCIASLVFKGLNYGIEFTGGIVAEISYEKPPTLDGLRAALTKIGRGDATIQQFAGKDQNKFEIRLKTDEQTTGATIDSFLAKLQEAQPDMPFRVERKDYVGPAVGQDLAWRAKQAVVLSLGMIILYVWFRFLNLIWGVAGVIALAHDVSAVLGLYSLLGCEINLVAIAAVLTIAGYSMHDTIVVYDRMREKMRILRREPLGDVINGSINETLSRSIITSLTVFISVVTLYFIGGRVIHDFALGMTFGVIVGTYSSIAVAAPIVYQFELGKGGRQSSAPSPAAPSAPLQPQTPAPARPARDRKRR